MLVNSIIDLSFRAVYVIILDYSYRHRFISITNVFSYWFMLLLAEDFLYYWLHRFDHEIRFFWAVHVTHHSSEYMNLTVGFRSSVFQPLYRFIYFIPLALCGFRALDIMFIYSATQIWGILVHTELIDKLGWLEYILVTPSHHRVHHAINPQYLDKNYGQIFIFWDKLFGTYQEELKDTPPVYGITRPVHTWNPIKINFIHLWLLIKDAWHTKSLKDKLRIWLMPTGWRPADVAAKYPVFKIVDVYHFEKYEPAVPKTLIIWSYCQLVMILGFASYLFGNIARINQLNISFIYWYGLFVFLSVYAYTELMDKSKYAFIWEMIKNCMGIFFILRFGDWFGVSSIAPVINQLLLAYFSVSAIIAVWFCSRFSTTSPSRS